MLHSGMYFVSAGDNIKIWDATKLEVVKQYNHHKGNIKDICWSGDNSTLCSTSSCGDKIINCDWKHIDKPKVLHEYALDKNQTCMRISLSGRKIYSGGVSGDVNVWDKESGKLRKSYKDTHANPVTCIALNDTESFLASGSNKGNVVIRNLNSDVTMEPQLSVKGQAVRSMVYSPWKHSLLGMALDDGSVNLWDSLQQTVYHNYSEVHKAPSMSFAFSPFNHLIFSSVGLDKCLVVYDVKKHKVISKTLVEQPLTSVTFNHDGVTLFAGSSLGRIYQFDLRSLNQAVKQVVAHSTSVQKLAIQNSIKVRKSKSKKHQEESTEQHSTVKTESDEKKHGRGDFDPLLVQSSQHHNLNGANDNGFHDNRPPVANVSTPSVAGRFNYNNDDDFGGLISPVRDEVFANYSAMSHESTNNSNTIGSNQLHDTVGSYCDDILSPVVKTTKPSKSRTPNTGVQVNSRTSPHPLRVSNNFQPDAPPSGSRKLPQEAPQSKMPSLKSKLTPDPVARQPPVAKMTSSTPLHAASAVSSSSSASSGISIPVPGGSQKRKIPPENPDLEKSESLDPSTSTVTVANSNGGDVFQYQAEYLRNTVKEMVDEMGDDIRQQTNEMMTMMVKLFIHQEDTIRDLIRQQRCGINDQLLQEVERLKEENERLRRTF